MCEMPNQLGVLSRVSLGSAREHCAMHHTRANCISSVPGEHGNIASVLRVTDRESSTGEIGGKSQLLCLKLRDTKLRESSRADILHAILVLVLLRGDYSF